MNSLPCLTVIVPCYNERQSIRATVEDLHHCLAEIDHAIVIVDDGSTDGTEHELDALKRDDPQVTVVRHSFNRGYGAALKSGIRATTDELLAITDADQTYPHEVLPQLYRAAETADMAVGARVGPDVTYSKIRSIPKFFLRHWCSYLAGRSIPDINSGLRVFRRSAVERFLPLLPDGFSFTTTITLALLTNNQRVEFIPIGYRARVGKSKIRPIRDTLNFMQLILRTASYFAPLRVFLPVAALLSLAFLISITYDVFILGDLTEKTLLFFLFAMNSGMFALLADMIAKRST